MNGTQVLGRALDILFVLGESERTLSVCEIAEKVAIPESTAYRLLQTLEQNGIVERKAKGQIGLGLRILDLARNLHQQIDHELFLAARGVMDQLTEETNETSLLAVRTGLQAICIERVESPRLIRFTIPKGKILPLHKGASGKAILAYENKRILEQLNRTSKDTPVNEHLEKELDEIVQNGYCMTMGEVDMDVCGIAAPIYDGYRRVIASLTVVGPIDRFPEEARDQAIARVMESARQISDQLAKVKR